MYSTVYSTANTFYSRFFKFGFSLPISLSFTKFSNWDFFVYKQFVAFVRKNLKIIQKTGSRGDEELEMMIQQGNGWETINNWEVGETEETGRYYVVGKKNENDKTWEKKEVRYCTNVERRDTEMR